MSRSHEQVPGEYLRRLQTVLVRAFVRREDLARFLRFQMDLRLDAITAPKGLEDTIYEVLEWAEANGRLPKLVREVRDYFPANSKLAQLADELEAFESRSKPSVKSEAKPVSEQITPLESVSERHRIPMRLWGGIGLLFASVVVGVFMMLNSNRTGDMTEKELTVVTNVDSTQSSTASLETTAPSRTPSPSATPSSTQGPSAPPPDAQLDDTWVRPADDMVMVYVPGGSFQMGSASDDPNVLDDERPLHHVILDTFWMDRNEVTNAQYTLCFLAGNCETSGVADNSQFNGEEYPVVGVSWFDATDYCTWVGARLPTEAEWEYAARGPDGRRYPWGDEFDGARVNFCDRNCDEEMKNDAYDDGYAFPAPVGSYPAGASWVEVFDMSGNVWEWTQDWYESGYYDDSPIENPGGPENGELKALRGGGWPNPSWDMRAANRVGGNLAGSQNSIGFRCVVPTSAGGPEASTPASALH